MIERLSAPEANIRCGCIAVRKSNVGVIQLSPQTGQTSLISPPAYREWTASPDVPTVAYDECTEQVDNTMRLRGYPLRPLPETPQFGYRKEIFAQCMRRKGYTAD